MLLDRKRINKWAKWVALLLAVVFAVGFLFMGVGYGGAGFNLSSLFTREKSVSSNPQTVEEKIAFYQAALDTNAKDVTALLGLATVYQQTGQVLKAAPYLEEVIAVDPSQKEVYVRLAELYMSSDVAQYQDAVTVLNKATSVDPDNPAVYLKLGIAQNSLGNNEAAILAWGRYLQLVPNGEMAPVVREQIDKLSAEATTTTTGSTAASESTTTSTAQ